MPRDRLPFLRRSGLCYHIPRPVVTLGRREMPLRDERIRAPRLGQRPVDNSYHAAVAVAYSKRHRGGGWRVFDTAEELLRGDRRGRKSTIQDQRKALEGREPQSFDYVPWREGEPWTVVLGIRDDHRGNGLVNTAPHAGRKTPAGPQVRIADDPPSGPKSTRGSGFTRHSSRRGNLVWSRS